MSGGSTGGGVRTHTLLRVLDFESSASASSATPATIGIAFTSVKDSRNRKVRGLWRRGEKLYMQTRVAGEKSARKIPLKASALEAARAEMAGLKKQNRTDGLPDTGLRPAIQQIRGAVALTQD